jgi:drug/metabolite transporter (DMT)-like permease
VPYHWRVSTAPTAAVPPAIARTMSPAQWAVLVTLAVIWGGAFFFGKVAVAEVPPFSIVLGRMVIGMLVLHAVLLLSGQRLPADRRLWGMLALLSLVNNVIPFSLIFWGETRISGALASILGSTTPIFTVLLAHYWTIDERLSGRKVAGVLLGIAGAAAMVGHDALSGLGDDVLAQGAVLLSSVCYAIAAIYARRFRGTPPLTIATIQVTWGVILSLPLVLLIDHPWTLLRPGPAAMLAILGLGLLCTALAYILYFRLLAQVGATNVVLVTFLIPVSGVLLGYLVLHEQLQSHHFLGMALIALGLAAIDGRAFSWLRSRLGRREALNVNI